MYIGTENERKYCICRPIENACIKPVGRFEIFFDNSFCGIKMKWR